MFFFLNKRQQTSCALVSVVQTGVLPIWSRFLRLVRRARSALRSASCRRLRLSGAGSAHKGPNRAGSCSSADRRADARTCRRAPRPVPGNNPRSEEHTSELQSLMRISYAVFCLKKTNQSESHKTTHTVSVQHRHKRTQHRYTTQKTERT